MATTYKFTGNKNSGDGTDRIILEGSSADPKRFVDRGGTIELTDEEVETLRKEGRELQKVSDQQVAAQQKAADEQSQKRGADQAGTSDKPSGRANADN